MKLCGALVETVQTFRNRAPGQRWDSRCAQKGESCPVGINAEDMSVGGQQHGRVLVPRPLGGSLDVYTAKQPIRNWGVKQELVTTDR